MAPNNRSSLLLSTLSAIDTSFTSPAMTQSPSVFSSATISSMASSIEPQEMDLKHPSPRRYEALNSPLLKSDMVIPRIPSPPQRPISPLSPLIARNTFSFLDTELSPTEYVDSPLSSTSEYYCLRQGTDFRNQWSKADNAPTPPPQHACPVLPPSAAQRAAIRQWESKVNKGTPAPPSPLPPYSPTMQFDHQTSKLISPVEQDIEELSLQINELHQNMARSDDLFKHGMMSVFVQQNAAAARLACSPTDELFSDILFRPSSVDSVSSVSSFHRRNVCAKQRSEESFRRAAQAARQREEQRMQIIKISLMDRIEREVDEIEQRAIRDLEMVREARYALRMEIEREQARERRRILEAELAIERHRIAAEEARRQDEEDAEKVLGELRFAAEAIMSGFEQAVEDEEEEATVYPPVAATTVRAFTPADIFFHPTSNAISYVPSLSSSPSLSNSGSTRPSSASSQKSSSVEITQQPKLSLNCQIPSTVTIPQGPNTSNTLNIKSPLFTFLASPISPCSPNLPFSAFASARASMEFNGIVGLGFELSDLNEDSGVLHLGMVAPCA